MTSTLLSSIGLTDETKKNLPLIPLRELLKHTCAHDEPWTALFGIVYNVKEWRNKHPGGGWLIDLAAGRDATILWEGYHPSYKKKNVKKFVEALPVIGRLKYKSILEYKKERNMAKGKGMVNAEALGRVGCDPNDKFWVKLNERVNKTLKSKGIHFRSYGWFNVTEVVICTLLWIFALYFNLYSSCHNWTILFCTAVLQGFCMARIGFFQHSSNHGGSSTNATFNRLSGMIVALAGFDYEDWIYWHQGSHHIAPNQLDIDANLTNNYAVNRLHRDLEWRPWHIHQVLIYNLLLLLGWIKFFTLDIYHAFKDDRKMLEFKPKKGFAFWAFKLQFVLGHWILPRYFTGGWGYLWTNCFALSVGGYYLGLTFLVSHYHGDLYEERYTKTGIHWSVLNVVGTANWCSGDMLQNWFFGGIPHQIEHHLWPAANPYILPLLSKDVKQTCEDFGILYRDHKSFFTIWKSFINYLVEMGVKPDWQRG